MTKWNTKPFLLLLLATASALHAADWPNFRGPKHNGISSETDWNDKWPADGPKQLWKASVGTGFSSVSIAAGRVYTMGNTADQDTVYCFDAQTGKPVWQYTYPCPTDPKYYEGGPSSTPTIDGKQVFTISRKGDLFCLDAESGKVIWSTNLATQLGATIPTWGFAGSPLVDGNSLILNVGGAGTALDKTTGKVLWTSDKQASGYSTPVPCSFGGVKAVTLAGMQAFVAVDATNGKQLWQYPWKTKYDVNAADPIIIGDEVFISSGYDHGSALLRIHDGKVEAVWENKMVRNFINSPVLLDGFLYGFDGNPGNRSFLKCVELATGNTKWSFDEFNPGAAILAGGKLIVISDKGELAVANASPEGFKPISRAQVLGGKCWTAPALADGRIYCRNSRGDLVCLSVK